MRMTYRISAGSSFSGWLEVLLRDKGADLFRIKGVLPIKGVPDKYVYHAVHMIYEGRFTEVWAPDAQVMIPLP